MEYVTKTSIPQFLNQTYCYIIYYFKASCCIKKPPRSRHQDPYARLAEEIFGVKLLIPKLLEALCLGGLKMIHFHMDNMWERMASTGNTQCQDSNSQTTYGCSSEWYDSETYTCSIIDSIDSRLVSKSLRINGSNLPFFGSFLAATATSARSCRKAASPCHALRIYGPMLRNPGAMDVDLNSPAYQVYQLHNLLKFASLFFCCLTMCW